MRLHHRPVASRLVFSVWLVALATTACKSERQEPAPAARSASAGPPPTRPLPPEPAPLEPRLAALVDDVATDPLVHEDFRLLLDGLSTDTLLPLMRHRIKSAAADVLACAHARSRAALAEAKTDTKETAVRVAGALEIVLGALASELTARKLDPGQSACAATARDR